MKKSMHTMLGKALAISLCMGIGMPLFATGLETVTTDRVATITQIAKEESRHHKKPLTKEQKAEIQAKNKAIQTQWDSLTDAQKEEIYVLQDQITQLKEKKIDKFAELGVIDKDTQVQMKNRLTERNKAMRENGKIPLGRMWRSRSCK